MLSELAEYAREHKLAAQAGFKQKSLKGYIDLSAKGEFLGIEVREKGADPVFAPDIGSAANGTRYCNPLVEKAKIPLCMVEDENKDKNIPTKSKFFQFMLESGGEYEPRFNLIREAVRSEDTKNQIIAALGKSKLKGSDVIGFKVDGFPIEESAACGVWWKEFRKMFIHTPEGNLSRCFVTGELAPALATVPKVSGLLSVGGHTSGDAFLCFDKDAFQSYGLKKSANASVSEEGMTAVNAALTDLIGKAAIFGGAKLVHWYAGDIPENLDPLDDMMNGDWGDDFEDEEETEEDIQEKTNKNQEERTAISNAKQLMESIYKGQRPSELSARYYIMPVSGAGGRMMVRGWYEGSFEDLYKNIDLWFDDLKLISVRGKSYTKPPKLKALCTRLLKPGGDPKKVWERMDSELSNLSGRLLDAIIKGNPLPDEVAVRALRYTRSTMLSSPEEEQANIVQSENLSYQLIKAWLVRHQRQKGEKNIMGCDVSQSPHTVAYCCGQLMAVYSAIQSKAMPDVNVGIAERYYAAASSTPAFVIGKLAQLSQHHLSKLEEGLSIYYQRMLSELYIQIGQKRIPTSLNMEQQTEFALGYYQQRAVIYKSDEK